MKFIDEIYLLNSLTNLNLDIKKIRSKIENQKLKVLHVAPEQVFFKKFKKFNSWTYTTTDLNSPLADVKANLCNLPFKDECFDLILCNHVLEHIVDDIKAMEEIYRVLKPKGKAIIQVPLNKKKKISYENYDITDPKERSFHFGQYDHVRIYGMYFFERLSSAGSKYEKVAFTSTLIDEEIINYGLIKGVLTPAGWK